MISLSQSDIGDALSQHQLDQQLDNLQSQEGGLFQVYVRDRPPPLRVQ